MEMKKGMALVLLMFGMITTVDAKRAALRDMDAEPAEEAPKKVTIKDLSKESPKKREARERRQAKIKEDESKEHYCFFKVSPDEEERAKKLYSDLSLGFIKYNMPTITMVNAAGGLNTVSLEHSSLMPMVRGGMGVEIIGVPCISNGRNKDDVPQTTRVRIGWQALYAKKDGAIETIYISSAPSAVPNVLGLQDVERGEFMAVLSYDLIRDRFSIEGGLGVVGGALKDFALYQPPVAGSTVINTDYYTGQYLKPNKANFGGFIGANLAHRFKTTERVLLEFGYRCVFSDVKYHKTIYQNQPGVLASQPFQNGFLMAQTAGNAELPTSPKFKVRAQEITFTLVAEF